jgi:regulator of protease activity HflC (stomatin/prohibitin superfamily)
MADITMLRSLLPAVDGGQRAVIWHRFRGGIQDTVVGEGTHFRIPMVEVPTLFDIRLRPRLIASKTGTKDLQQVTLSLRVLSRPAEEHLPSIYRSLGEDFDERVLPSIVNEVLKATVVRMLRK